MWQYQNTDELYHWGVLGMKWGHRRYQNKDGSLTTEGKQRYAAYNKHIQLKKNLDNEGNKLIAKNKALSKDFGGDHKQVDDHEFFSHIAKTKYKLDTRSYDKAYNEYSKHHSKYSKYINSVEKEMKSASEKSNRYTRRQKRGFKDANKFGQSFARVEDSTRIIRKNTTPGKQLLVPSDVKNNYKKQVKDFTKNLSIMNKKYKDVKTRTYTDKRKRLCSSYII